MEIVCLRTKFMQAFFILNCLTDMSFYLHHIQSKILILETCEEECFFYFVFLSNLYNCILVLSKTLFLSYSRSWMLMIFLFYCIFS